MNVATRLACVVVDGWAPGEHDAGKPRRYIHQKVRRKSVNACLIRFEKTHKEP